MYNLSDPALYSGHLRLQFAGATQFDGMSHEQFRLSPGQSAQIKQRDHSASNGGGSALQRTSGNQFPSIAGANPLFSHERVFLNTFNQTTPNSQHASLAFTPINRSVENPQPLLESKQSSSNGDSLKTESQEGIWHSQTSCTGMDLHDEEDSDQLQM